MKYKYCGIYPGEEKKEKKVLLRFVDTDDKNPELQIVDEHGKNLKTILYLDSVGIITLCKFMDNDVALAKAIDLLLDSCRYPRVLCGTSP